MPRVSSDVPTCMHPWYVIGVQFKSLFCCCLGFKHPTHESEPFFFAVWNRKAHLLVYCLASSGWWWFASRVREIRGNTSKQLICCSRRHTRAATADESLITFAYAEQKNGMCHIKSKESEVCDHSLFLNTVHWLRHILNTSFRDLTLLGWSGHCNYSGKYVLLF